MLRAQTERGSGKTLGTAVTTEVESAESGKEWAGAGMDGVKALGASEGTKSAKGVVSVAGRASEVGGEAG